MNKRLTVVWTIGVLIFSGTGRVDAQSIGRGQDPPDFLGNLVTVLEPRQDADGTFNGPASVCVESLPEQQCYTAPEGFGRFSAVSVDQIDKDASALLFSAASYGVSGWSVHFALLRPGVGNKLKDLFMTADISVSNQSQHGFWDDSAISDSQIFVTADAVWSPDEADFDRHRYIVSAYVRRPVSNVGDYYYLEDRYMTLRRYASDKNENVLRAEKQEALARLARVMAESQSR